MHASHCFCFRVAENCSGTVPASPETLFCHGRRFFVTRDGSAFRETLFCHGRLFLWRQMLRLTCLQLNPSFLTSRCPAILTVDTSLLRSGSYKIAAISSECSEYASALKRAFERSVKTKEDVRVRSETAFISYCVYCN